MTIAYPDDNRDAGSYNVVANFAEGANYLEGYVVFANALVINKAKGDETLPTIDRQFVDTVLSGAIGETGWSITETTIVEGENDVIVTKTISAEIAKNYDFTEDAVADGYQVAEQEDKSLVLTATITVVGYYGEGTVKLVLNTIEDNATTGDVTIKVTGEDVSMTLTDEQFVEAGNTITINGLSLVDGTYTMTVKKQKYLEAVITFTVKQNESIDLGTYDLIAGDIIGDGNTNGDGVIDIDDFVIAIRAFDSGALQAKAAADIDGDNENTVSDLSHIKTNFHKTTADNCTVTLPVVSE